MQASQKIALVADDHALFRAALSAVLKRDLGFADIIETGSLEDAMDALSRTRPVAIACFDLAMPGMDGARSLTAVREKFPDTRVAVLTGSTRREDILHALAAGAHGYVPKVLRIEEITRALRLMLDGMIFVPPQLAEVGNGARAPHSETAVEEPPAAASAGLAALPPRQREVLRLLSKGKSNKDIALALNLAESTVKVHLAALFRALGVQNRAGAVAVALRLGVGNGNGNGSSANA